MQVSFRKFKPQPEPSAHTSLSNIGTIRKYRSVLFRSLEELYQGHSGDKKRTKDFGKCQRQKLNSHCGGSQSSRCFKHVPNFKVLSLMAVDITVGTNPRQS